MIVAAGEVTALCLTVEACLLPLVQVHEQLIEALDDEGEDRDVQVLVYEGVAGSLGSQCRCQLVGDRL